MVVEPAPVNESLSRFTPSRKSDEAIDCRIRAEMHVTLAKQDKTSVPSTFSRKAVSKGEYSRNYWPSTSWLRGAEMVERWLQLSFCI